MDADDPRQPNENRPRRQPRRVSYHPRYTRGTRLSVSDLRGKRLSAAEIRRARDAGQHPETAPPAPPRSRAVGRAAVGPVKRSNAQPTPVRRRWSKTRIALASLPIFALAVLAAMIVPTLLKARTAYEQIFSLSPAPHVRVTENAAGTPFIDPQATQEVKLPDWNKKERVNILLLGVDSRTQDEIPRSDTIIIVSIDPATKQVGMMSIPRDLLVTIPGVGKDKINAAYSDGAQSSITGPGLVRATIEYNFKITIHYVAEVDFQGFQKIVDTLGGVTVDVPAPIKDDEYPGEQYNYTRVYFHAGLQHMDGATALQYARTRHDDDDFSRGNRQQQVLMALRQQGVNLKLLTKAPALIQDLGNTVRTDLAPTDVLALAKLATEIKGDNIQSYSLASATTSEWSPGQPYYLIPDWDKIQQILAEMMPPIQAGTGNGTPTARQPDLQASILAQNATRVSLLASNAASKLEQAGFTDVGTGQSPEAGNHPTSRIVLYSGSMATARRRAPAPAGFRHRGGRPNPGERQRAHCDPR